MTPADSHRMMRSWDRRDVMVKVIKCVETEIPLDLSQRCAPEKDGICPDFTAHKRTDKLDPLEAGAIICSELSAQIA